MDAHDPETRRPRLRLVRDDHDAAVAAADAARRRREIARENRVAARQPELDPRDPRWVLAARTHAMLQGSALDPERRRRLMRTAERLGVPVFEAGVIIALVQDQARRGGTPADALPTLAMVPAPETARRGDSRWSIALRLGAAIVGALVVVAALVRWTLGR